MPCNLIKITQVGGGFGYSIALLENGIVTGSSGRNDYGQSNVPIGIGNNASGISVGNTHSLALLKNGSVTGWGELWDYNIPNIVKTQNSVEKISAGGERHSLALLKDGRVTGWGYTVPVSIPNNIPSIQNNVASISAGRTHCLALLKNGSITGWGDNTYNQITIPTGIGTSAVAISAANTHSLALLKDGRVTGWGTNYLNLGQINVPTEIGNNATGVAAGWYHSLALLKDGRVTGWGGNTYGQIDIPPSIGTGAVAISAGNSHSLAILKDGSITGWGTDSFGNINIQSTELICFETTTPAPAIPLQLTTLQSTISNNYLSNNQNYNIEINNFTKKFNGKNNQPFYLGLQRNETYTFKKQSTEKFFKFEDIDQFTVLSSNSYTDVSSLNIDFSENEPHLDIYNQVNEEISLTYVLDNINTPSGLSAVNMTDLKAFTMDFDTFRSGEITSSGEMPFMNYKKYISSGEGCPPKQQVDEIQDINPCSKSFICAICSSALKIRSNNPSQTFIDVPKQSMLFGIYGNLVDYIFTNSEVGIDNYRITLNDKFFSLCCLCKEEKIDCSNELLGFGAGGGVDDEKCPENNLFKIPEDTKENKINQQYGLYFLDAINLKSIKENYGKDAFYSGEIINPNKFIDGDKIQFNQYSYPFEEVHKKLYGFDPIYKAVNTEFIYSSTITGEEYFFTASELVDKINLKFNSTGIYSWLPMLYNKYPRYSYGPLLSGKLENDSKISLISLKSGRLGEHAINLDLGPRSVIVSYLLPKVIELQGSNNGSNWDTIVSSKDIQPVNILKTNPNAVGGTIKYEEIDNTKVIREVSLPVGSTTGIRIIPSGRDTTSGDLANLIDEIESGNKQFATGNGATIVCIPSSGKLSKICGTGYLELYIPSGCPIPKTGIKEEEEEAEEEGEGEKEGFNKRKIKIEDNVYRIGFVNYLE